MPRRNPDVGPVSGPTPIPGNKGYYPSGNMRIGVQDIDALEQQLYGTIGGTPVPAPGSPSTGRLSDVTGPNSLGSVVSGSGPTSGENYYDAGNGITYVYDENWNYIRTDQAPNTQPQPSKGGNDIASLGSRVGSYFNPGVGGFLPLGGSAISGATMLPTTWSNANTGNPGVYAPRALPGGFNGGMISMNPGDWGVSGGIGPQAVSGAAPGPNPIRNIVHR